MLENEFYQENNDFVDIIDRINLCYNYIQSGTLHLYFEFIENTIEDCIYEELIEEGLELCDLVLATYPNNTEVMILKGRLLNENSEYKKAVEIFNKVLEVTNSSEVYSYVAESYLGISENDKAKYYLDLAIEFENNDPYLFELFGKYYKNVGKYKEAIAYFEKSIDKNGFYLQNYFEIAYCYERLGQREIAASYYVQFLDYDPFNAVAWYNYGILLNDMKKYEEAIGAYDNALSTNPEFADAWYNKGITYINLGDYHEALECFNQAQLIDKYDEDILFNLAKIHQMLNEYDKAINAYNKLLTLSPNNPDALLSRAACYLDNMKFHLAERDILYVYENYDDKKDDALMLLAELYTSIGNAPRAIECYEAVMKNISKDKSQENILTIEDVNIALINLYLGEYQIQKAINLLIETLKINPASSECYFMLSKIYNLVDKFNVAKTLEKQACSLEYNLKEIYEHDYPNQKITKVFSNKILSN